MNDPLREAVEALAAEHIDPSDGEPWDDSHAHGFIRRVLAALAAHPEQAPSEEGDRAPCTDWEPTTEPYGWCTCGATVKRQDWLAHRAPIPVSGPRNDDIAEVLAAHVIQWRSGIVRARVGCTCGDDWEYEALTDDACESAHRAHVAAHIQPLLDRAKEEELREAADEAYARFMDGKTLGAPTDVWLRERANTYRTEQP